MNKLLYILIGCLIFTACKKEVVIYDGQGNENFEISALLKLSGKDCFYDEESGTLKFSLAEENATNFTPFVKFKVGNEINFNGVALKNDTINNFGDIELHKHYDLTIKTAGEIKRLQLWFTSIPTIQVVVLDEVENEPKSLAKLTVNYPELDRPSQTNWVGIEFRGASSLSYPKKSYGFRIYNDKSTEFVSHASFFDYNTNEDWILDALYIDHSKLRNKTSFELWKSMGESKTHVSINSRFVELFVNNNSQGLYAFTEDFTHRFLDLDETSVLYKGGDNSEITYFEELPNKNPVSVFWGDWEQKFPNPSERIVWDDFEALNKLIINADNASFKAGIADLIDLDNVIDYYLFINLCSGFDNIGKNWCFLKKNSTEKFRIVPWDLDATWGRDAMGDFYTSPRIQTNAFFKRLVELNPKNFNSRLKMRWAELRSDQFSMHNLTRLFGANFETLRSYKMDDVETAKWDKPMILDAEEVYIKGWIEGRLTQLDDKFY